MAETLAVTVKEVKPGGTEAKVQIALAEQPQHGALPFIGLEVSVRGAVFRDTEAHVSAVGRRSAEYTQRVPSSETR